MKKYGVVRISKTVLEEWLFAKEHKEHRRRITELPDDIEIIGVRYDPFYRTIEFMTQGDKSPNNPLVNVPEGGVAPAIDIAYEDVEE